MPNRTTMPTNETPAARAPGRQEGEQVGFTREIIHLFSQTLSPTADPAGGL